MKRWHIIHSTISFGRKITLAPDPTMDVFADTEERADDMARALGLTTITGYKYEGLAAA